MNHKKSDWIKSRQSVVWEPEILISGIVLIGLLQVPQLIDRVNQYLNDWGPFIFFTANLDEVLAAFLKTSVFFLIVGLIINLFLRSIWVVMVGMSYLFPKGYNLKKFNFQPYFQNKFKKIQSFDEQVIQMDRVCSYSYSLTFFAFMCVVGLFTYLLIVGGIFAAIYSFIPIRNSFTENLMNTGINAILQIFGGIYFLDFITLGWFKRIKWLAKVYRPIYVVMSFLTVATLYRSIYYALISEFNRWKIFTFLVSFIFLIYYVLLFQMGDDFVVNKSTILPEKMGFAAFDGYYRDKNPKTISHWLHIPSAHVSDDVLEVFVAHKAALEDSIYFSFERLSGLKKEQILENDSLKLSAMSEFYRFKINGKDLPTLNYRKFHYTQYHQKGLLGFIPLDSLPMGTHDLQLHLNFSPSRKYAQLIFYKTDNGKNFAPKPLKNEESP
ncbi:MAG: hypothetical protein JJU28_06615 [Cyclobacteriaceae bacterium]|nr:hypothetical protein [Cyclobacteriaceae bacterium]